MGSTHMLVTINGEKTNLTNVSTVNDLIIHMNLTGRIAVEINKEIVPRSQFTNHNLLEGDSIEIVHAIGGG